MIEALLSEFSFHETTPLITKTDCIEYFSPLPKSILGYDPEKHSEIENLHEAFYALSGKKLVLHYKLQGHHNTSDGYPLGTNVWLVVFPLLHGQLSPNFFIYGKTQEMAAKYALQFATGFRKFHSDAECKNRKKFMQSFQEIQKNLAQEWAA